MNSLQKRVKESPRWKRLLQDSHLASRLAVVDDVGPNRNQKLILENILSGTSLVTSGAYGQLVLVNMACTSYQTNFY